MQPTVDPEKPETGAPLQDTSAGFNAEDFRPHWKKYYAQDEGDFEDYSYIYLYGAGLTSRLSGREWADIEPAVRMDWEEQYPESRWDHFKAAVRHGWEKAMHR